MRALAVIGLCATIAACGYAVVGSRAIFDAHTIAVIPFTEIEPIGLAPDLSQELSTLLAGGGIALARAREGAEGVLVGEIKDVSSTPFNASRTVVNYRLRATVEARLVVRGDEVWTTTLNVTEEFLPSRGATTSNLTTEAYRREAVARLAESAAKRLYEAMIMAGGT